MSDAERIWRDKSDEDLLDAAAELGQFTEEGRSIIRAELKRRGLEDPVEQAAIAERDAPVDGDTGGGGDGEGETIGVADGEGESLPGPECLRCKVELRYLGTRDFHEGAHLGIFGELGHLFEHSESFDVYMCPRCGHVDLFADGVGEDSRPA